MEPLKDYYRILQVEPRSGPKTIRAAYRRLSKLYHPDAGSPFLSTQEMQEINEAYGVLSNPVRRLRYDYARAATWTRLTHNVPITPKRPLIPAPRRRWAFSFSRSELLPILNLMDAIINSRWFAASVMALLFTIYVLLPPETRTAVTVALLSLVNPGFGMR